MRETIQVSLPQAAEITNGEQRVFTAGDYEVLVVRVQNKLYAVENMCSHAESPLCDGMLNGYLISCPLHGAAFDVRDGKHKSPPAFAGIRCFPIAESSGDVSIEVPAQKTRPGFGG